jgi:extradiol dioxygenase family protein
LTRNLLGWPTWIGLVVENLDVQRRFYRDTLGLPETDSALGWVHVDLGGSLFQLSSETRHRSTARRVIRLG